jgi:hypothetical protein
MILGGAFFSFLGTSAAPSAAAGGGVFSSVMMRLFQCNTVAKVDACVRTCFVCLLVPYALKYPLDPNRIAKALNCGVVASCHLSPAHRRSPSVTQQNPQQAKARTNLGHPTTSSSLHQPDQTTRRRARFVSGARNWIRPLLLSSRRTSLGSCSDTYCTH